MTVKLSVNINKFATLRNARGHNNPNLVKAAKDVQNYGADGITVHPRPDERHIRYQDVLDLKPVVHTEFNVEGYPDEKFLQLVEIVRPTQVTFVPDAPNAITSNNGWDTKSQCSFLTDIVERMHASQIRVSLFLNPEIEMVEYAQKTGAERIELYTEMYASEYAKGNLQAIQPYLETANAATACGLEINAGHDLDLHNLNYFVKNIVALKEVSIGHALICDAIYLGLNNTVQMYKARCNPDFQK